MRRQIRFNYIVAKQLAAAPPQIQRRFIKQVNLLLKDFEHNSLQTHKYRGTLDIWQARVNDDWRFYFRIEGDTYDIIELTDHPK
jgi:plasmid maintenance system killer protein